MAQQLRPIPWYPIGLVVGLVLVIFVGNNISAVSLGRPLALAVVGAITLLALASLALRDVHAGAAATAVVVIGLRMPDLMSAIAFVALMALLYLVVRSLMRRRGWRVPRAAISVWGNRASALFLIAIMFTGVLNGAFARSVADLIPRWPIGTQASDGRAGPRIHILMLDGYPRADALANIFGYDNSPFLDELAARGFDVGNASLSNYTFTAQSLASMLQMRHLPDLQSEPGERLSFRRLINDNPVFRVLRAHGYDIAWNLAPWDDVAVHSADELCGAREASEFEWVLLYHSALRPLTDMLGPLAREERHRRFTNEAFRCWDEGVTGGRRFTFTHVPLPHIPIAFAADGSPASPDVGAIEIEDIDVPFGTFAASYVEQLEYLNERVLSAIDSVAAIDPTAVVILFSDHGIDPHLREHFGAELRVEDRFKSLFASRTPGRTCLFGADATPNDLFPILLAEYLDEAVPTVERRHYDVDSSDSYDFRQVEISPSPAVGSTCPKLDELP